MAHKGLSGQTLLLWESWVCTVQKRNHVVPCHCMLGPVPDLHLKAGFRQFSASPSGNCEPWWVRDSLSLQQKGKKGTVPGEGPHGPSQVQLFKGSWEAILPCYGQIEFWVLKWWRVVRDWHLTLKGGARLRLDLEGWCAIETWSWRVVCDWDLTYKGGVRLRLDLEGWCAIETWPWWRVVRDWDLTLMKGGVRLNMT